MGIDVDTATPDQIKTAMQLEQQQKAAQTASNKMASMNATREMLLKMPIGWSAKDVAVYAKNADGTYQPINGLYDPRASYQNYLDDKVGTVPKSEIVAFNQQQAAVKLLDRFKQVVQSKATAGHYIPEKPGLRSYIGEPAREFAAIVDPRSAARPVMDATVLADIINKSFTNRTIQAQLQRVMTALMNPHGTVESTEMAIDETKQLIQMDSEGIIGRGKMATSSDMNTDVTGEAAPPLVTSPTAEPSPAPLRF
jgi:hypothetical protein